MFKAWRDIPADRVVVNAADFQSVAKQSVWTDSWNSWRVRFCHSLLVWVVLKWFTGVTMSQLCGSFSSMLSLHGWAWVSCYTSLHTYMETHGWKMWSVGFELLLKKRTGTEFSTNHAFWTWAHRHAAWLINCSIWVCPQELHRHPLHSLQNQCWDTCGSKAASSLVFGQSWWPRQYFFLYSGSHYLVWLEASEGLTLTRRFIWHSFQLSVAQLGVQIWVWWPCCA